VLREIVARVGGARLVTAALGDAADEAEAERAAHDAAAAGAALVKLGFAGVDDAARATALARAAVRGARAGGAQHAGLIVVGYADATAAGSLALDQVIAVARASGARGVLVDTAIKGGPGLFALITARQLGAWVAEGRAAGLLVAVAGQLAADDLPAARAVGAHVVGVRGAACEGGRGGTVSASRVRALRLAARGGAVPATGGLAAAGPAAAPIQS
jgi:uncharacterized protein (UPF0264 family)